MSHLICGATKIFVRMRVGDILQKVCDIAAKPPTHGHGAMHLAKKLLSTMPLLFGIGFVAPLLAQTMAALGVAAPWGLSRSALGCLVGAPWGLYAMRRGRWL